MGSFSSLVVKTIFHYTMNNHIFELWGLKNKVE